MRSQANRAVFFAVAILMAMALCASAFGCSALSQKSDGERSLFNLLEECGYAGTEEEWIASLADEQLAAMEIAYEASESSGYEGSKSQWLSEQVRARADGNGNIVVVLPDGGEFAYSLEETESAAEGTADSAEVPSAESNDGASQIEEANNNNGVLVAVDTVQARSGDRDVAVPVRIEGNPGILGMTLSVSYDESALTLKTADSGEVFAGHLTLTHSREFSTGCLFTWDGIDLAPSEIEDGVILVLHFDVSQDAEAGMHAVAVRASDAAYDVDLAEVAIAIRDGGVLVE